MTGQATTSPAKADPSTLTLEFRHAHRLVDHAAEGVQTWQISLLADDESVAWVRATRGQFWKAHNLGERMADEESLAAVAAKQLFDDDGQFRPEYENFVDLPGNVLVVDDLHIAAPWDDPWIVAGLTSSIIDRLTDNQYAVVLPRVSGDTEAALLTEAGVLLSAEPFSDELLIIDTSLAAPEEAAHRVREHLRSRARYGGADPLSEDWDEDDDEGEEVLTARTRAVLHLALQELSDQAWQEVSTLGDQPAERSAGGLFGSLPRVTWHQDGSWRRQMARAFDDLAADCSSNAEVEPRSTGEEMALHLGIARAQDLTRNRPRLVRDTVAGLPEDRADFDWGTCSDVLFQDHDVLMLFDHSLDGIEQPDNEIHQSLGMVNLAPHDWFAAFDPDQARDPDRGFRHP
ncbi:hypothetical protein StrepF001_12645 [Streptomyces sp. F001]|uniref:hypothetical protein n=1 Tax=Streptomyces sp. F001 TaxID=1510026 RepID=UPI00101E40D2|nr:hypothetical protein [Streptomyces sp. F001]RZB19583.1 hypothetical protein StrepF001_12645 [Streptomyces sp. F001]